MKSIWLALILCVALAPLPALAQNGSGFGEQALPHLAFDFDIDNPASMLEDLVVRGMAYVRNHVEISKQYNEGPGGDEIEAKLEVKVFPNGKEQPGDSLKGSGAFEFFQRQGKLHLRFDFNLSPGSDERRLDDYL